ncbi:MAG TPA: YHS domain-containing (seleno)protein [Bradyrhizobium sp.]|nr:YHS domain-containing (seleno)protein [Bradyrhizobium sp.]
MAQGLAPLIGLAAGIFVACQSPGALAATTERIVVNRFSGLAIEGFDPVAYFIRNEPMLGLPDFEAAQAGAVWRFRNEGNRASFVAHPEIYGPQFGGYDPVDVARGVALAGNPRFFAVVRQRLYLFGIEAHRDAFATDPGHYLPEARERWPALEDTLSQ